MSTKERIEIISCGPGLSEVNRQCGRSSDWLSNLINNDSFRIDKINAYKSEMPTLSEQVVWIILGSKHSVYDSYQWISNLKSKILDAIQINIPMLGICFGHQIILSALGAKVVKNKKGWEIGSSKISLTDKGVESRLFKGIEKKMIVYESHQDTVTELPKNISVLANNSYGLQSFSYGENTFGVQFHPEFNSQIMNSYMSARSKTIKNINNFTVTEVNSGRKVVSNFIELILGDRR